MTRALVLDPERKSRRALQVMLEGLAIESVAAASAAEAIERFAEHPFDLVLTDLDLPDVEMLDLLPKLRELGNDAPIIVLGGYDTVQTAVDAVKLGAFDFALKPFSTENLERLVRRALERRRMPAEIVHDQTAQERAGVSLATAASANVAARARHGYDHGVSAAASSCGAGYALEPAVEAVERRTILRALGAASDNKAQAARLLRVSERTLWYKLKRYGL